MSTTIIIPTLDAAHYVTPLMHALDEQDVHPLELIVLDSESSDGSADAFREAGARVEVVPRANFHHATVRNHGASLARGEVLVFMTQDARPADGEWLGKLVEPLLNGSAAASYARQVPYRSANPLERFARLNNYPDHSNVVSADDIARLGVRAFFFSNSCSAVRRDIFEAQGGFPTHTIMNEDMILAARLLRSGYSVAYVAEAVVEHSHHHSLGDTFRRYFDIGVVFAQAPELAKVSIDGEGLQYTLKLIKSLIRAHEYAWIPAAFAQSAAKWLGVSLGKKHRALPQGLRRNLSLNRNYWG